MKEKTFYGSSSNKGEILGNLVKGEIYFNCMIFHIYVKHRIGQTTNIVSGNNENVRILTGAKYEYYDVYSYEIDTRKYHFIDEVFKELVKEIRSIDRFINLSSGKTIKVTEELLRVLG